MTEELPDSGRLAGVVTTAELVGAGFTRSRIRTLIEHGELYPILRGVYARKADAGRLATMRAGPTALRVTAATAAVGGDSAGAYGDAAALHRLDLLCKQSAGPVTLVKPVGEPGSRSSRPGIRLHVAALPSDHRAVAMGTPVTSVARTVIDLARTMSFRDGVVVADSALRSSQTTKPQLWSVIDTCAGWRGITQARQTVEFSDERAESPFESIARVVFHRGGLPPPDLQTWVGGEGQVIGRADFFWSEFSTIAEADGAIKYSDPQHARMQLDRDARLRAAGFEVVHFGWHELQLNPDQVVQAVRAAFGRAVSLRSRGPAPRGPAPRGPAPRGAASGR